MFNLIRPCKACPFRSDIRAYLTPERAREIANSIMRFDKSFACHETTAEGEDGERYESSDSQHCAGATIFLERMGRPNQMMRISERLGMYDRAKLDMNAPVYRTAAEFIAAQPRPTPAPPDADRFVEVDRHVHRVEREGN